VGKGMLNSFFLLILIVLIPFASFYITRLVRILPVLKSLNERGIKPIACNTCMSFWTNLLIYDILYLSLEDYFWLMCLGVFISAGITLILLEKFVSSNVDLEDLE
jgi:hypothetical protein